MEYEDIRSGVRGRVARVLVAGISTGVQEYFFNISIFVLLEIRNHSASEYL